MSELSEDQIQIQIMQWAQLVKHDGRPIADYIHHSPNGGKRHIATAKRFKKMGVKAGYPDLIIDIARGGFHGLRIEIKKEKGGSVSKAQKERLEMLTEQGYRAIVCKGFDETINEIKNYMEMWP